MSTQPVFRVFFSDALKVFLEKAMSIEEVNKKFGEKLEKGGWREFLEGDEAKLITKVSIPESFTDSDLQFVLQKCLSIEELTLSFSVNITEKAFLGVGILTKLKKLDFMGSKIRDTTLSSVLRLTPNLEDLSLLMCNAIDGSAFTSVRPLFSLHKLIISFTQINDEILLMLLLNCRDLEVLYCGACRRILGSVYLRAPLLPKLKKFYCVGNEIDDSTFDQFLKKCPSLQELCLEGCFNLTGRSLAPLPLLEMVNLSQTKVSSEDYKTFLANCPRIKKAISPETMLNSELLELCSKKIRESFFCN